MDWKGDRFEFVRVKHGKQEEYMELKKANSYGYRGKLKGECSLWTQPIGKDGKPKPVYYGFMPVVFRGEVDSSYKKGSFNTRLSARPHAVEYINRLLENGVAIGAIQVVLAVGDLWVFVDSKQFHNLIPDPRFPRKCDRITRKLASGLPFDSSIYVPEATKPLYGSRVGDDFYVVQLSIRDLRDKALPDGVLVAYSRGRRVPRHPSSELTNVINIPSDPTLNPVGPSLRNSLPEAIKKLLQYRLSKDRLEPLCFSVALAVKDVGGTTEDAMMLIDTAVEIDRLDRTKRLKSVLRAFHSNYRYGHRSFIKAFPELADDISADKSPFIHFERQWLEALVESGSPYTAHQLLYELLVEYHSNPRTVIPIPEAESKKLQREALRSLMDLGIVERVGKREVRLLIDHVQRSKRYVRLPVDYLNRAIASKQAVRLFTAIISSSLHKKDGLWTTRKVESLAKKLDVAESTIFNYLKTLRYAGIPISTERSILFPNLESEIARIS